MYWVSERWGNLFSASDGFGQGQALCPYNDNRLSFVLVGTIPCGCPFPHRSLTDYEKINFSLDNFLKLCYIYIKLSMEDNK